jgi:glyoxylase-like metal-dependent hydrolase (beta-lactamase superfamily II)
VLRVIFFYHRVQNSCESYSDSYRNAAGWGQWRGEALSPGAEAWSGQLRVFDVLRHTTTFIPRSLATGVTFILCQNVNDCVYSGALFIRDENRLWRWLSSGRGFEVLTAVGTKMAVFWERIWGPHGGWYEDGCLLGEDLRFPRRLVRRWLSSGRGFEVLTEVGTKMAVFWERIWGPHGGWYEDGCLLGEDLRFPRRFGTKMAVFWDRIWGPHGGWYEDGCLLG